MKHPSLNQMALDPGNLRKHILKMAYHGQSVHIGCAFSLVEIMAVLYSDYLENNLNDANRKKSAALVMSKGHGIMAQYACMRELGCLNESDLLHYFANGSKLRGLAEMGTPGIDVNGGSLGHGLPIAVGMALGAKLRNDSKRIFCVVGDGEMNEGSMWEAVMFAVQHHLNNLTVIVDLNGFQAMGKTEDILSMNSLRQRLDAFGFYSLECDGHDTKDLQRSLETLVLDQGRPQALIARTVKGKGVSFMEHNNIWHYTRLTSETYAAAVKEVES